MLDTDKVFGYDTPNASPNAQNGLAQSGNLVMRRDAAISAVPLFKKNARDRTGQWCDYARLGPGLNPPPRTQDR